MKTLRTAVIGAGGGRGSGWCQRVKKNSNINGTNLELVAGCDLRETPLKATTNKYNIKAYLDYNEMFEKEDLDLVIIATPHYVHAPQSITAAEHGVHVLTEKIMCINLEQADAMKSAVDKNDIKLAVGFQKRFDKNMLILKNLVASGDLGQIFQVNMNVHWWRTEDYYLNSTPVPDNEDELWEGWRGHWPTEGAGALSNQMIHFLDLFQWFAPGNLKECMAMSKINKHTLVETDDNTNAVIGFDDGSMGNIQAGVAYEYGKQDRFEIYGTEGAIIYQNHGLKKFLGLPTKFKDMRKASVKATKKLSSYADNYARDQSKQVLVNLVDAIVQDDSSIISVDVEEGRKSVELMRAMLVSEKKGGKITVPFDDKGDFPELQRNYSDPKYADLAE